MIEESHIKLTDNGVGYSVAIQSLLNGWVHVRIKYNGDRQERVVVNYIRERDLLQFLAGRKVE